MRARLIALTSCSVTVPPNLKTGISTKEDVEDGEINSAKLPPQTHPLADKSIPTATRNDPKPSSGEATKPSEPATRPGVVSTPATTGQAASKPPVPQRPLPAAASKEVETRKLGDLPPLSAQPSRPGTNRNISDSHVIGRLPHSLPNRPDQVPGPARNTRMAEKPFDKDIRDHREGHFADGRRNDWNSSYNREQPVDRHGPPPRGYDRPPDNRPNERERPAQTWAGEKPGPRNAAPDDRYGAPLRDSRPPYRDDLRSERVRDDLPAGRYGGSSMQPPRAIAPPPERAPPAPPLADPDRVHGSMHTDRRGENPRYDNSVNANTPRSSRAPSPNRRPDDRAPRPEHHSRDDRPPPDARRSFDAPPPARSRYDDARPPAGPRTDRPGDLSASIHATKAGPPTGPQADTGRGYHDSGAYRQTESQYGRLNNNSDAPSGPRLPNGNAGPARGLRSGTAIQSQVNMPAPSNPSSMQSSNFNRSVPAGPAHSRPPRNTNPFGRPPPASSSAPTTPASEAPDTAGVHHERLKAIQSSNDDGASGGSRNPPPNLPSSRGPAAPQPAAPAPSGRPSVATPAAGPVPQRERADRRFTGLNTVLQQSSVPSGPDRQGPGANLRPRATRPNGQSPITSAPPRRDLPDDATSYPSTRSDAPGPGPLNLPPPRPDLFAGRNASGPYQPKPAPDDDRGRGGERELRPPRHRDNRSLSPPRRPPPSAAPAGPGYARDDLRAPPPRDHRPPPRTFSGPPPGLVDRDGRRGPRDRDDGPGAAKDRDRRDPMMDRRDSGGWPADRHGPDRRERDRRDEYELSGPGRKRVRGPEDGFEQGKRSRHGP